MTTTILPDRILKRDICIGCGAHVSEPCHPRDCPFETGNVSVPVILRLAAHLVPEHYSAGSGVDLPGAILAAATQLVGQEQARAVADHVTGHLAACLEPQWGYEGNEPVDARDGVRTYGQLPAPYLLSMALYGIAAGPSDEPIHGC